MKKAFIASTAAALTLGLVGVLQAQNWQAVPTYGTQNLTNNFQPDPVAIALQAGGADRVTQSGCAGYIQASAPDVDLNYTAGGGLPLNIYVKAAADTTLLVYTPSQTWVCDDDGGSDKNPLVSFASPESGNYNIWVGNYDGTDTPNATLYISEIAPQW